MEIKLLRSNEALNYISDLAQLRISIFAEFPYLYNGNMDYEKSYLEKFLQSPDSIICLVLDGIKVIGACTAIPLLHEHKDLQNPFIVQKEDMSPYFYLSEMLILPDNRKLGLGNQMMTVCISHASSLAYPYLCLCTVIRAEDHPRRPLNYHSADLFFQKHGFEKMKNYICTFSWQDWDEIQESDKSMQVWRKTL
ncbi:MAG: GNAT family N-acetyltransferase [Saprospiraceae bacterium]